MAKNSPKSSTSAPKSAPGPAAAAGGLRSHALLLLGFTLTIFLSAWLLFSIQPMFTKMVLPVLGGSPSVWAVALVFFQGALLAGYCYAHFLAKKVPPITGAIIHVCVLLAAFISLPIRLPAGVEPPPGGPYLWQLGLFTMAIGLPFFAVSANAPLMQAWFARTGHPDRGDPYFLYAASNFGSLLSLLAYPFFLEPYIGLRQMSGYWTIGYALLVALIAGCALALKAAVDAKDADRPVTAAGGAGSLEVLFWIAFLALCVVVSFVFLPANFALVVLAFAVFASVMMFLPESLRRAIWWGLLVLANVPLVFYMLTLTSLSPGFKSTGGTVAVWMLAALLGAGMVGLILARRQMAASLAGTPAPAGDDLGAVVTRWGRDVAGRFFAFLDREIDHPAEAPPHEGTPSWGRRAGWVGLAFVPSALLNAFTTHVSTDIASAPLIWIIPLAVYLLTFVLVFRDRPLIPRSVLLFIQLEVAILALLQVSQTRLDTWFISSGVGGLLFFTSALVAHRTLYEERPGTSHLTEFYLWMSLGGVLGGIFTALIAPNVASWFVAVGLGSTAPKVFSEIFEYPIIMALTLACRPHAFDIGKDRGEQWLKFWIAAAVTILAVLWWPRALELSGITFRDGLGTAAAIFLYGVPVLILMLVMVVLRNAFGIAFASEPDWRKIAIAGITGLVVMLAGVGYNLIAGNRWPTINGYWLALVALVAAGLALHLALKSAPEWFSLSVLAAGGMLMLTLGRQLIEIWQPSNYGFGLTAMIVLVLAVAMAFFWRYPPRQLVAALMICFTVLLLPSAVKKSDAERSFFGVYRTYASNDGDYNLLIHGTTLHGAQKVLERDVRGVATKFETTPGTYYHPASPMARSVDEARKIAESEGRKLNFAVIGLGSGSLACLSKPDESVRYFEIDPVMVNIATDRDRFTFLTDCRKPPDIVLGDARLTMAKQTNATFDLIIVDAFSSDAIPMHLMTAESMKMFLDKLKPNGILVMHISNRYLDLESVLGATQPLVPGMKGIIAVDEAADGSYASTTSSVGVFTKTDEAMARFKAWPADTIRELEDGNVRPWTDDSSEVLWPFIRRLQGH